MREGRRRDGAAIGISPPFPGRFFRLKKNLTGMPTRTAEMRVPSRTPLSAPGTRWPYRR